MRESAPILEVSERQRDALRRVIHNPQLSDKVRLRVRIILAACEGMPNYQIAKQLFTSRPTVILWRNRYMKYGLEGILHDAKRDSGRKKIPPRIENAIIRDSDAENRRLSARDLAKEYGISPTSVCRIWRRFGITSQKAELKDIVGFFFHRNIRAIALSVGSIGMRRPLPDPQVSKNHQLSKKTFTSWLDQIEKQTPEKSRISITVVVTSYFDDRPIKLPESYERIQFRTSSWGDFIWGKIVKETVQKLSAEIYTFRNLDVAIGVLEELFSLWKVVREKGQVMFWAKPYMKQMAHLSIFPKLITS